MTKQMWVAYPRETIRFIAFNAEEVDESDSEWVVFRLDDKVVGRFLVEHLAGWWIEEASDQEEEAI